jgi:hypothetical protein
MKTLVTGGSKPTDGTNLNIVQQWLSQLKNGTTIKKWGKPEEKEQTKNGVSKLNSEDISRYELQSGPTCRHQHHPVNPAEGIFGLSQLWV